MLLLRDRKRYGSFLFLRVLTFSGIFQNPKTWLFAFAKFHCRWWW